MSKSFLERMSRAIVWLMRHGPLKHLGWGSEQTISEHIPEYRPGVAQAIVDRWPNGGHLMLDTKSSGQLIVLVSQKKGGHERQDAGVGKSEAYNTGKWAKQGTWPVAEWVGWTEDPVTGKWTRDAAVRSAKTKPSGKWTNKGHDTPAVDEWDEVLGQPAAADAADGGAAGSSAGAGAIAAIEDDAAAASVQTRADPAEAPDRQTLTQEELPDTDALRQKVAPVAEDAVTKVVGDS